MLLGLWVDIGALVASAPGVQAEEGRALRVTDDTARHLRYTSRAKREADVSLSHRCTMVRHARIQRLRQQVCSFQDREVAVRQYSGHATIFRSIRCSQTRSLRILPI